MLYEDWQEGWSQAESRARGSAKRILSDLKEVKSCMNQSAYLKQVNRQNALLLKISQLDMKCCKGWEKKNTHIRDAMSKSRARRNQVFTTYPEGDKNMFVYCYGNTSNGVRHFTPNHNCKPQNRAGTKVRRSPKSFRFILWATWITFHHNPFNCFFFFILDQCLHFTGIKCCMYYSKYSARFKILCCRPSNI